MYQFTHPPACSSVHVHFTERVPPNKHLTVLSLIDTNGIYTYHWCFKILNIQKIHKILEFVRCVFISALVLYPSPFFDFFELFIFQIYHPFLIFTANIFPSLWLAFKVFLFSNGFGASVFFPFSYSPNLLLFLFNFFYCLHA